MNLYRIALAGITLALAAAVAAHATNGLYLTGYGAEAMGRGGANLAVSDRSLGLNSNPAGIAQLQGDHFTASLAVLAPTLEFENMVNRPDRRVEPLLPAARLRLGPLRQGDAVGLGRRFHRAGWHGRDLQRAQHLLRHPGPELHPGALHDDLADRRLLLQRGLGDRRHAEPRLRRRRLPPVPVDLLFNTAESGDELLRAEDGGRRGTADQSPPRLVVAPGAALDARRDVPDRDRLDLRGRQAVRLNFEAMPGLGQAVRYDAEMNGFTFAAQAGVGTAFRATDDWLIAFDVKRYFWDAPRHHLGGRHRSVGGRSAAAGQHGLRVRRQDGGVLAPQPSG